MLASLHGWEGTDYVDSTGGVTNRVVLYSNRGATTQPFLEKWGPAAAVADNQIADATGRIPQTALTNQVPNVAGSDFATVGSTPHTKNAGDQVSVSGTFDGASGTYSCQQAGTTACSSAKAPSGVTLAGGWFFTPSPGAMISTPDASWLAYGWWSRETANGVEVSTINQIMVAGGTQPLSSLAIEGTATYRGGAAGKYAIYNPLGGSSVSAGAFTADAMLTANFTTAVDANSNSLANVSGEITGFMSGGEAMDWTVTLLESPFRANPVGLIDNDADATEWTIGGTAAAESGSWNARFFEADATTDVPQTAYGQFISTYGNTGQITGAFGVDLED